MTDDKRRDEGIQEPIEDLEAPAASQEGVHGGAGCMPTEVCEAKPSCNITSRECPVKATDLVIVHEL